MFFLKKDEIKICGTTYPISNACQVDCYNSKQALITSVCLVLSNDQVGALDPDNYVAWRKELIKALKDWDKTMTNHIKKKVTGTPFTVTEEVADIHKQAFTPLTDMYDANKNFYNVRQLMNKGHVIPEFRFNALEEEFVKKMTRMCEIFRDYGSLTDPFNIR